MQISYGLQVMVPCATEEAAPEVLAAWGAYASKVLAGYALQADANRVEFIDWDDEEIAKLALARFWVKGDATHISSAAAMCKLMGSGCAVICNFEGACTQDQFERLYAALKLYNVEGYQEVYFEDGEVHGTVYADGAPSVTVVASIMKRM